MPALREVFQRYDSRARYYIETKNPEDAPGMEEKLLALIGEFGLTHEDIARRVLAIQKGRPIYSCSVSFQQDEEGFSHQTPSMPDVPGP